MSPRFGGSIPADGDRLAPNRLARTYSKRSSPVAPFQSRATVRLSARGRYHHARCGLGVVTTAATGTTSFSR